MLQAEVVVAPLGRPESQVWGARREWLAQMVLGESVAKPEPGVSAARMVRKECRVLRELLEKLGRTETMAAEGQGADGDQEGQMVKRALVA